MPPRSKYGLLAMLLVSILAAIALWPRDASERPGVRRLTHVTYAVATADLNVGYPFATLPAALGYFREEGLDVTVVPGQSTSAVIQLLLSGRADIGVAVPESVMGQRATTGAPLISVFTASRTNGGGMVVRADSPVHSIADLRGKRIGTPDYGSGAYFALRRSLISAGIAEDEITLIATGYGTPSYEAVQRGDVDATYIHGAGLARALIAGYKFRLLPRSEDEINRYSFNLYARTDYIAAHPQVIAAIGRATAKATVFLKTNPQAAVRIFWDQYPDRAPKNRDDPEAFRTDFAILEAQMKDLQTSLPVDFTWGSHDPAIVARMQADMMRFGQIKKPLDVGDYFTNRFVPDYNRFDHGAIIRSAQTWPATHGTRQ
jgi:NitT/TauT family transport system substrate-binding protein